MFTRCNIYVIPKQSRGTDIQSQTPHATSQLPLEYHKCTIYSTSFSSINRLLSHNQMTTCGKSSCKHYEGLFDNKNKLHKYLRNQNYQQSPIKNKPANKTDLTPLSTLETKFNDADIAIKKGGINSNTRLVATFNVATFTSVTESLTPHDSGLSALVFIENITFKATEATELFLSSAIPPTTPPPTYLTIADLYMRYAPLNRPRRITITRTMSVLPIMSIQDLYKRFDKKKLIIPHQVRPLIPQPIKIQHSIVRNLGSSVQIRLSKHRPLLQSRIVKHLPRIHSAIRDLLSMTPLLIYA